jgi:hypothetical protein
MQKSNQLASTNLLRLLAALCVWSNFPTPSSSSAATLASAQRAQRFCGMAGGTARYAGSHLLA